MHMQCPPPHRARNATYLSCWDDRGTVTGRAELGLVRWEVVVQAASRHGTKLLSYRNKFYSRSDAEDDLSSTVQRLRTRAFGGLRRRRRSHK